MSARISLCLIVRDEEAMLSGFLESVRGLWDELCVVDTGSKDNTVAVLERAGAKVTHRPWTDDFSAARNASLAMASGEWICVLDPDERVSTELRVEMRRISRRGDVGAATFIVENKLPHGHVRRSRLLRLFRRSPEAIFHHAIHEDASEGVEAMLARTGMRCGALNGSLIHLGYEREHAVAKSKKSRDIGLLQRCLEKDANDLYSHFKLLEQCRFWSDVSLWKQSAPAAAAAIERASPAALAKARFAGELVALAARGLAPADPRAQLDALTVLSRHVASSPPLMLSRGELHEQLGELEAAAGAFESCLERDGELGDLQLTTVRPHMGLCRVALARNAASQAVAHVAAALASNPCDPEALLAALVLRRRSGGKTGVDDFVRACRAQHGESPELNVAIGEDALLAGEAAVAIPAFERAHQATGEPRLRVKIAQALLMDARIPEAREIALHLAADRPDTILGVVLCDVLVGRDISLEVELDEVAAKAALREWASVIGQSPHEALRAKLRACAPALEGTFPWFPKFVAGLQRDEQARLVDARGS